MQLSEFAKQYEKLCHAYDRECKKGQLAIYYEYLGARDVKALEYAVNKIILSKTFFPKVAEIIDEMKDYKEIIPVERQLSNHDEPIIPKLEMKEKIRQMISGLAKKINLGDT